MALITGHENPTKIDGNLDWQALARFPGTLVFYMAMARLENMTNRLMGHGKSPDTPACIIAQATLPSQRVLVTTLGELVATVQREGLASPAIVVVGGLYALQRYGAFMDVYEKGILLGAIPSTISLAP